MPPCWIFGMRSLVPCVWRGLVWRLAMLRPSTTTATPPAATSGRQMLPCRRVGDGPAVG